MTRYLRQLACSGLLIGTVLAGFSGMAAGADTCGRGISEPPFLAYGINSNLLMLLDNSGSMLDMAYVDPNTQCFDESFTACDPTDPNAVCYAGNYDLTHPDTGVEAWYQWHEGTKPWGNKAYGVGDIVYANGAFFQALTAGTSDGTNITEDTKVKWDPLLKPSWKANKTYHAHSFVFDNDRGIVYYTRVGGAPPALLPPAPTDDSRFNGSSATPLTSNGYRVRRWASNTVFFPGEYVISAEMKLYYTIKGGTSCNPAVNPPCTKITNDSSLEWIEKDYHGWRSAVTYQVGDLVTTAGMVYTCKTANHLSSGNTIYEDGDFTANWQRLDEGYFELLADETAARDSCATAPTPPHLNAAKNESFENGDICVKINNPGLATSAQTVLAFAATGNFLNWAMSSKFDIQKDILTGGKYNKDAQRVVGETRGCAGNRFIKQVAIQETAPLNQPMKITMTIRKSDQNDRVDSTDDTSRFEIYAITQNGIDFSSCQAAIEGFTDPTGVGPVEQDVAACVGIPATGGQLDEHTIYHKAMQACWYRSKHGVWKGGNDYKLVADGCQNIYWPDFPTNPPVLPTVFPANIGKDDPYRVCYGIYDGGVPHTQRDGYIGRCWEPGPFVPSAGTCQQVACDYKVPLTCTSATGTLPCYYSDVSGTGYRCSADKYLDRCPGNYNSVQKTCNKAWVDIWKDTVTGLSCTPATIQSVGFWEADTNDNFAIDNNTAEETSYNACVETGLWAYCQMIEMPEVIDPSDEASTTEEVWNLPGILIDAGIVGQLGGNPLLATKAYIFQDSQPQGILHDTAEDLRIGAMAFNANGAKTECTGAVAPVDKFCPKTNKDGAQVISPIKLGSVLTADVNGNGTYDASEDTRHVDDMAAAINKVRATSWTPLAEAMYNAIGYYTQNTQVRLNGMDFQTDADVFAGWANTYEYAPGSYVLDGSDLYKTVLGGISVGASRATDTGVTWTKVGTYKGAWTNGTLYAGYNIVSDTNNTPATTADDKLYITYRAGTSNLKAQAPKSSPLFDQGLVWEPLLDPVARWCQENHVLIITEGASTADINSKVVSFTDGTHAFNIVPIKDDGAVDNPPATQCSNGLEGSTYLDDLTYFGKDANNEFTLYPDGNATLPAGDYPFTGKDKKTITTHIVVAGTLRSKDIGTDPAECNPATLMDSAAVNGGTPGYLPGENPAKLKKSLLDIFSELRQRASAGSAASVISSARGGEGAIYQAIFWPQLTRKDAGGVDRSVNWAGDVHGLFLDSRGYMYEDTNHDRTLRPYEDLDGDGKVDQNEKVGEDIDLDGHFDNVDEDLDLDGHLDKNEDVDGDGHLDVFEPDTNGNSILDPAEDLDGDGHFDINEDTDGDGKLDTANEDLDNDGRLDTGEDVNHNNNLDPGEDLNGDMTLQRTEDLDGDGAFAPFLDLDGDGHRDVEEQLSYPGYSSDRTKPDGDDKRVIIYFDDDLGRSLACYDTSIFDNGACTAPTELTEVNFLWSVNEWLSDYRKDPANPSVYNLDPLNTATNRPTYLSNERSRYIFTWNDLDNDGMIPSGEVNTNVIDNSGEILALDNTVDWGSLTVGGGHGPVANDFNMVNNTEVQKYVSWLRGEDNFPPSEDLNKNGILDPKEDTNNNGVLDAGEDLDGDGVLDPAEDVNNNGILDLGMRSRTIPKDNAPSISDPWRMGDIIHSTPMTVASPAEGYHLIYNDFTYAQFLAKYKGRRHVVYFGANDGMLHAVNAGFYSETEKKFCLYPLSSTGRCTEPAGPPQESYADAPPLGAELWAYVPYNLLPHLKCLADPDYVHKYFVDQRPRIFDVQIFQEEGVCRTIDGKAAFNTAGCVHPNGWGTIMVSGMRFGGAPVKAAELNGTADPRRFASSWFVMDITNPEEAPVLLGEISNTADGSTVNFGYTVGMPTLAIMKDKTIANASHTKWYLVFGSGPVDGEVIDGDVADRKTNALKGVSDLPARVSVLPLDWLIPGTQQPLRIPKDDPRLTGAESGTYTLPSDDAFVSDMITVDFDINPSYEQYKSDVLYFGTVEGDFGTSADGTAYWNGGGKLYRLVNKEIKPNITPWGGSGSFYGRGTTEGTTVPSQWEPNVLIDLSLATGMNQPITAAPSVGTDGNNFWIYFGTGRFFDADDKTDDTQHSYYGIKEPAVEIVVDKVKTKILTWDQVGFSYNNMAMYPGDKGLWKVDDILVGLSYRIKDSQLSCLSTADCLPSTLPDTTLYYLDRFIGGTGMDRYNSAGAKIGPTPPTPVTFPCTENSCVDGWYRDFYPYNNRERNVGQATLLGGLVTYTTYQPYNDVCQAEGNAYLYGLYYRTGTAWHKNIFGGDGANGSNGTEKLNLGRGLATTPNLHVGGESDPDSKQGPKAFVQTSTGEIREIEQENLPIENYRTGRSKWRQCN